MSVKKIFGTFRCKLRALLPKTIFTRFILIAAIPIFLMQCLSFGAFYNSYWSNLSNIGSRSLKNEIQTLNTEFDNAISGGFNIQDTMAYLQRFTDLKMEFLQFTKLDENDKTSNILEENSRIKTIDSDITSITKKSYKLTSITDPVKYLKDYLASWNDTYLIKDGDNISVMIKKDMGILSFSFRRNRIIGRPISIMISWSILPTILLSFIAVIFIKNQVKSIKSVTKAIADFSFLEKDSADFKPTGATEIRDIGYAFLNLKKKIKKVIDTRTIMLAEISHDLRTPMTRMKLQTEFIEDEELKTNLQADLSEMEKMINEYLHFTKNENENDYMTVDAKGFFVNVVEEYKRSNYNNITLHFQNSVQHISIKYNLFKRAINNIINNSLKYAKNISITLSNSKEYFIVSIDDDGIGLSESTCRKINKSFYSLRNSKDKDGIGLGLSIVQNIVDIHYGKVVYKKSELLGGLCVSVLIPINKNINNSQS